MEDLVRDFLSQKRFAVVGSFRNKSKYAYKIFRDLTQKGYDVFPVNPNAIEVDGRSCSKNISAIQGGVDVVNLVTPAPVTEAILRECLEKKITRVWMQPGAESDAAIKFCRDNGIKAVHGICVMLESFK